MKKIINDPIHVVSEMLEGFVKANPKLKYCKEFEVISKKEKYPKVGIVSGGGSGHEPAHAGYVGKGMLDAAVAGNVFASPSPDRVLKGIEEADTGKGVLLIIKNYSGDIMNFEMAKEIAKMNNINIDSIVVKDDVAVQDGDFSTGRRGIAGTIFVHKIAGAKAEQGGSLAEVKAVAEKVLENTRSMGMAMSSCTLPAVGKPGFTLGEDMMEIGMGIHGEPGVERTAIKSSKEIAKILVDRILEDCNYSGAEVAVIVNGMGSTPLMELYILANDVERILSVQGISIYKMIVGNFMTAIDMYGCSITLMKLDDELKELLNAPCDAPSFKL